MADHAPIHAPNPSLERQVFPPGYLGDALYIAGKLPGEIGNMWGKVKSMMPMMQNDPQNVFPQRAGMQLPPQAPGQQMMPQPPMQLQPPAPPQPGAGPMLQPPNMSRPGGPQPQPVTWGGPAANPGMMRPAMQQFPPQPQPQQPPNIFANRAMAY